MAEASREQLIAFVALGLGVVALLTAYLMQRGWSMARRRRYPWIAGVLAAAGLFYGTRAFGQEANVQAYIYWIGVAALFGSIVLFVLPEVRGFLLQVREELRKVVWPTKEDTQSFTLVVLVAVAVVAVFVGFLDLFLAKLVQGLHVYGK